MGTPLERATFVVVDLETTGGAPGARSLTEIGAVKVRGGQVLADFSTLVNPGVAIPAQITMLTGITNAMVAGAPGGRVAAVAPGAFWDVLKSMLSPGPVIRMVSGRPNAKDLAWLAAKVNIGELKPILAATYPLDRIAEAHRDAESLSAAGKRVVLVQ